MNSATGCTTFQLSVETFRTVRSKRKNNGAQRQCRGGTYKGAYSPLRYHRVSVRQRACTTQHRQDRHCVNVRQRTLPSNEREQSGQTLRTDTEIRPTTPHLIRFHDMAGSEEAYSHSFVHSYIATANLDTADIVT